MTLLELMMRMKGGGGGVTPTGTKTIELNGVTDVAQYAEAKVAVQGGKSSYADPIAPPGVVVLDCRPNSLPTREQLGDIEVGQTLQRNCEKGPITPAVGAYAAIRGKIAGTTAESFIVWGTVAYIKAYSSYLQLRLNVMEVLTGGKPDPELVLTKCGTGIDVTGRETVSVTPNTTTLYVTENGSYSAPEGYDGISTVDVDVSGGESSVDAVALINRSIETCDDKDEKITDIGAYAFACCEYLTCLVLTAAVTMGEHAFYRAGTQDTGYDLPLVEAIEEGAFDSALGGHVSAANCMSIFSGAFRNSKVQRVLTPALLDLAEDAFVDAAGVEVVDLGVMSQLTGQPFSGSALRIIALRNTDSTVDIGGGNVFSGTPIADKGSGCYVLVPSAMMNYYWTNADWSQLRGSGVQFLTLEDYTEDGSLESMLDIGKINALLEN